MDGTDRPRRPDDTDRPSLRVLLDDVHVAYRVLPHGRMAPRRPVHVKALQGVSLDIHEGECLGVIGRNGAGKSTLLRAIAGLVPVDHGAVYATSTPVLLGVGRSLVSRLSGRENIVLGCLALGMSRSEIRERTEEIIEFSGIAESIDLPMSTYSSGMAARLKFAIASSVVHEILLLDEALATGDMDFKERSIQRMGELRDHADAVVIVSHSLSAIRASCTRVVWLDKGTVRADGPVEDVIDEYVDDTRRRRQARRDRRKSGPQP